MSSETDNLKIGYRLSIGDKWEAEDMASVTTQAFYCMKYFSLNSLEFPIGNNKRIEIKIKEVL